MVGMAAREREGRRNDDSERDTEQHDDSLPFHEMILYTLTHGVNRKLQFSFDVEEMA
jgi:hypothetical protein